MSQFGIQYHGASKRKLAGNGKLKIKSRDKKRHQVGGYFAATRLGEENVIKKVRARGGKYKDKLKNAGYANLLVDGSYKKVKIKGVIESKDNRNFARLNIITKGTIIDTEMGRAIVLNRPGKEGFVNAKLIR
ncbi:MAG: 30S ribosomal protein S8e [Candidatus Micrarchaeia archaeon]|jgi:small subunit ribosomal protein S8e